MGSVSGGITTLCVLSMAVLLVRSITPAKLATMQLMPSGVALVCQRQYALPRTSNNAPLNKANMLNMKIPST